MRFVKTLLAIAVMFLAANAFAATKITLDHPAELNGTQLAAGEYTVRLDGDKVTFLRGKTEVASAKAKLEDHAAPSPYDSLVLSKQGKSEVIREVTFKGKKQTAVIAADSQNGAGN